MRNEIKSWLTIAVTVSLASPWAGAFARGGNAQQQQQQQQREQQQQQRAQQDAQRAQMESQQRAQEAARRAQESQLRAQEEQARQSQQNAMREQQEQARRSQEEQQRNMQRQQEEAQRNQQRAMEEQQRNQQRAMQEQQQNQQRAMEEAQRNQQRDQQRAMEEAQKNQQRAMEEQQRNQQRGQEEAQRNEQRNEQREQQSAQREQQQMDRNQQREFGRGPNERQERTAFGAPSGTGFGGRPVATMRPVQPQPLREKQLPLTKSFSMPVLEPNATAEEREHAALVQQNLQAHLYAIQQPPPSVPEVQNYWNNSYLNNFPVMYNNQQVYLTPQNTYLDVCPPAQWPYWYTAQPGWQYATGYSFGGIFRAIANWLGFGWHPYYGPQPEGFVCASNYFPTQWIYVPAYGLWRMAGINGWAPSGPPYDYTGPISVQVWEPRHVNVRDPFTGFANSRVINVMYMYNAFFYPEYERWGYTNRHGYFVWLNL